jgi:hypothetical protein
MIKLLCLDRFFVPLRDPQVFDKYSEAVVAAGITMAGLRQGDVIELIDGGNVVLRMRCEKAAVFG